MPQGESVSDTDGNTQVPAKDEMDPVTLARMAYHQHKFEHGCDRGQDCDTARKLYEALVKAGGR